MFTGLIEEMGKVVSIQPHGIEIACSTITTNLAMGDSVAVNGVCLTVVAHSAKWFKAEVMPVTLGTTNLGDLKPGQKVNLERAMTLGTRLGGHLVAGHVDATVRILAKQAEQEAMLVTVEIPNQLASYIINKGSIALDGISLTVASLGAESCTVSLVGHTRDHTTLAHKQIGERVNMECDQIGKYVERLLSRGQQMHPQTSGRLSERSTKNMENTISMGMLDAYGFNT